jgi:hypothetical protein
LENKQVAFKIGNEYLTELKRSSIDLHSSHKTTPKLEDAFWEETDIPFVSEMLTRQNITFTVEYAEQPKRSNNTVKPIEEVELEDFYGLGGPGAKQIFANYSSEDLVKFLNKLCVAEGMGLPTEQALDLTKDRAELEKTLLRTGCHQPILPLYYNRQRPLLLKRIEKATTEEEVRDLLKNLALTEILEVAKSLDVHTSHKNSHSVTEAIINSTVRAKLRSQFIRTYNMGADPQ